ncbi:outer membrane lipoprotein carrier protein LolA [Endozoicomonas sp. (ex Bugula neritina AB1)]|nr:outer membrane lipoprotein carrier protein LolA [Endozoicomonas sp. (ex Bugula neritina AB1)]
MIKKRLLVIVLSSLCSLPLQAASVSSKPVVDSQAVTTAAGINHDKQAAEDLAESLQSIHSLSASFEQQTVASQGRVKTENGEVLIKRPNQFRWDTRKPFNQDIVSKDNKIWMVDTDLMQVVIKKQDDTQGPTPVQLLSGNASEFLKNYRVVRVGDRNKELTYTLRPVGESELFEQLDVTFNKGVLTSMTLKDSLGGKRRITFSDMKLNEKVDDKRFQINIPKDFDVIDETRS